MGAHLTYVQTLTSFLPYTFFAAKATAFQTTTTTTTTTRWLTN